MQKILCALYGFGVEFLSIEAKETRMKNKAWSGRFKQATNKKFEAFSESISYDKRLALYDLRASLAHVEMLGKKGIIKKSEASRIATGLKKIQREIASGKFRFRADLEDVHMNIESRLFGLVGSVAGKMHTGRSRNDLVLTDVRLWLKERLWKSGRFCEKLIGAAAQGRATTWPWSCPGSLTRARPSPCFSRTGCSPMPRCSCATTAVLAGF